MIYNSRKYRLFIRFSFIFSFCIALILGILLSIIVFNLDKVSTVSIFFIVSISLVTFSYLFISSVAPYWKMARIAKKAFPKKWEDILNEYVAFYSGLGNNDKLKFKQRILIFLSRKKITGIDTTVDDMTRILVAASAIIPIFKYDDWEYDDINEILVYPEQFDKDFQFGDKSDYLGLVTRKGGVVIISKRSLIEGFKDNERGRNVAIHEFAHKIDGEDGSIDGIPFLMMDKHLEGEWKKIREFEKKKIINGKSDIDPYALTNNSEFFAVVSEYFFSNPEKMSRNHPQLYNILKRIFKIDMKSIMKKVVGNMFSLG